MFPPSTKILIVDDMPAIRELMRAYLKDLNYLHVREAVNGVEALEILKRADAEGAAIELIIADWNMPEMNGMELLKKVRESSSWATLPFIMLTSEADRALVTQAVMAGVSQYIVKPFSQKIVKAKLDGTWAKVKGIKAS